MQSVFRSMPSMPWSANVTLNKSVAPFVAHADLSVAGNATNAKRKRTLDSSPRVSPVPAPKKLKSAAADHAGGAVRTAPKQYIRPADGKYIPKTPVMSVIAPKPVDGVQYSVGGSGQALAPFNMAGRASPSSYWHTLPTAGTLSKVPEHGCVAGGQPFSQTQVTASQSSATPPSAAPASIGVTSSIAPTSQTVQQGLGVDSDRKSANYGTAPSHLADETMLKARPDASSVVVPASRTEAGPCTRGYSQQKSSIKPVTSIKVNMDHVRAICELEINQAILTKHNELRLIDQEIAKCQVALEQIRRCELVPFPAVQGFSMDVASHTGPSLLPPAGHVAAPFPAPWGVTDGPYTQHYSSWLLQSGQFDHRLPMPSAALVSPFPRNGRPNCGSGLDVTPVSATFQSARAARASVGRGRHSVDGQGSQPQRDPLVIKRNQDNQWVKLYCTNCKPERSDFANVQGFLNHCRISHKLDYKSHEAAAIACGRVVQLSESQLPPEPVSARESQAKSNFTVPSPVDHSFRSEVHPLVGGPIKDREQKHRLQQLMPRAQSDNNRSLTGLSTPVTPTVQSGFRSAAGAPHLSQLMAKSGFAGDFGAHVESAKRKEDLSIYDDSDSDSEHGTAKKAKTHKKKGTATPMSGVKIKLKPGPKPEKRNNGFVTPSLVSTSQFALHDSFPLDSPSTEASAAATPSMDISLSPHAVEFNPGLVSDREDDDDEMDYEEIPPADDERTAVPEMLIKIEDSDNEIGSTEDSQPICAAVSGTSC